jgi:hypothetical protein
VRDSKLAEERREKDNGRADDEEKKDKGAGKRVEG